MKDDDHERSTVDVFDVLTLTGSLEKVQLMGKHPVLHPSSRSARPNWSQDQCGGAAILAVS